MKGAILTAAFACALAIMSPSLAAAQTGGWTERDICRAATKTYFFLREMPADTSDKGAYFRFVSNADNVYGCRVSGERAVFKWINNYYETMTSRSTTFHLSGNALIIKTDMKTERFEKD